MPSPDRVLREESTTAQEHWYRIYVRCCPICLHTETERERVYGPKPETGTRVYVEHWDGCNV